MPTKSDSLWCRVWLLVSLTMASVVQMADGRFKQWNHYSLAISLMESS
jgi:hypothetical protein